MADVDDVLEDYEADVRIDLWIGHEQPRPSNITGQRD